MTPDPYDPNRNRAVPNEMWRAWRHFCKTTNMQGVAHMHASHSVRVRVFWGVVTLIGWTACIIHASLTISNYVNKPVNTVIVHEAIDFTFPDVTICNLNPISISKLIIKDDAVDKLFQDLWGLYRTAYEGALGRKVTGKELATLVVKFMSTVQTSISVAPFSHQLRRLLVHCRYQGKPCGEEEFLPFIHKDYWQCFTFHPKQRRFESNQPDFGLNMILFTDNLGESSQNSSLLFYSSDQDLRKDFTWDENAFIRINSLMRASRLDADGFRLSIHEPDSFPMPEVNGFSLAHGTLVNLKLQMTQEEYVNRESSPCHKTPKKVQYQCGFTSSDRRAQPEYRPYNTSVEECIGNFRQRHYEEKCSCSTQDEPRRSTNLPWCYSLLYNGTGTSMLEPEVVNATVRRILCHDHAISAYETEGDHMASCLKEKQCQVQQHFVELTSVSWPASQDMVSFLNDLVIPKFRKDIVDVKHNVSLLQLLVNGDESNWSVERSKIRENFVKVVIHPVSIRANIHMEQVSYSFTEALSEIGGIAGLWVGLSILTIFEVIEFLGRIACSFGQAGREPRRRRCTDTKPVADENGNESLTLMTTAHH